MSPDENGGTDGLNPSISGPTPQVQTLVSRAYQLEMFEQSLKQNTIVCMDTGSGKTQIARLRIEAELSRKSTKLVWLLAPSQVLAYQQHAVLTSQLPGYSFRRITGLDNAEYWSSKQVWEAALLNQNGVVSTAQVLLDALKQDYLSLTMISLLVFDEAHHCMGKGPYNKILRLKYDPLKAEDDTNLPQILGLTASPMNRDDLAVLAKLEENMDSVCRSPTINADQYKAFTHVPELLWLPYAATPGSKSSMISSIEALIRDFDFENDPTIIRLSNRNSEKDKEKLEKYRQKKVTPTLEELTDLLNKSVHMEDCLGSWATDRYIMTCIGKLLSWARRRQGSAITTEANEQSFLAELLEPLHAQHVKVLDLPLTTENFSSKIWTLVEYLRQAYRDGISCVVFVERRSTAYGLCDVLSHIDSLSSYRCFTFVGSASRLVRSLADLAEHRPQNEAFADFRAGNQNVCIATEVLEEGIDVQACNLVVNFDLPKTFKSFIQRRGRARHSDAKYVLMHPEGIPVAKHPKWAKLEEELKALYSNQNRRKQEILAQEDQIDDADKEQPFCYGQALVEMSDARSKLEYFCATMKRYGEETPSPIYVLERSDLAAVTCSVNLPYDLPPEVRRVRCSKPRLTESAAKRDAAFQAYKLLHKAGLLNEHLMPRHAEARHRRGALAQCIETRDSTVEVSGSSEVWDSTRSLLDANGSLYANDITVPDLPPMILLLPIRLPQHLSASIYTVSDGVLTTSIKPVSEPCHIPHDLAVATTKFLYRSVLGRKLNGIERDDYMLPYYVVPELGSASLEEWLRESQRSSALLGSEFNSLISECLIYRKSEPTPYCYQVPQSQHHVHAEGTIGAVKFHRQINFTTEATAPISKPSGKQLPVEECTVSSLAVGYARFMAYLPTIMRAVELVLRAQQAREGPLQSVRFTNPQLLSAAFTASEAGTSSYQRLEYLGDAVLKFMATINVFCHNPKLNEGASTVAVTKVVNNARLHRSTLNLGLEAFLTTEPFASRSWSLASPAARPKRQLSTKVLADVIEALLGVAYIEGETWDFAEVVPMLQLSVPELVWRTPVADIAIIEIASMPSDLNTERFIEVQDILGYSFRQPILLVEALNHSSTEATLRSYDRLEFLGDAVIDLIVKHHFYHSPHNFSEKYMTYAGHALVNKEIFAFLTTATQHEFTESTITVDPRTQAVEVGETQKSRHLHDYMTRLPSQELAERREQLLKHYDAVQPRVSEAALEGRSQVWPWADLMHLDSPKWASDVLESLVGAVFIDSGASMPACEAVLEKLGLMRIVRRVVENGDVEFRQARERLALRYPGTVVFQSERYRDMGGDGTWLWKCEARVHGEVAGRCENASCKAEAEERASEDALAAPMPVSLKRMRVDDSAGEEEKEGDGDKAGHGEEVAGPVPQAEVVEQREEDVSPDEGEEGDGLHEDRDTSMQL